MNLDYLTIQQKLETQFPSINFQFSIVNEMLNIEFPSQYNFEVISHLKDDLQLRFNFLTDVCGIHFPENHTSEQLCVVYHMHNWIDNLRIRLKCYLSSDNPTIQSVEKLFLSANWQERETYDFYGITFKNHPQLKRILNMDEMTVFPMRKEFPMEDSGRTDKDDRFFGRNNSCQ